MSTNLHGFLRYSRDCNRTNIMTHIVTACLARLQHEHAIDDGDSGWQSHRNLTALADYLAQKGLEALGRRRLSAREGGNRPLPAYAAEGRLHRGCGR